MPDFTLRHAILADAEGIAEVHADSIRTLGALFYSAEIVKDWSARCFADRYRAVMEKGEKFFVAEEKRILLGFSSYRFEDGKHRRRFMCAAAPAEKGSAGPFSRKPKKPRA